MDNNFIGKGVKWQHYGDYSCESSGCHDEGICRCYRIHSVEILQIDIPIIVETILKSLKPKSDNWDRDRRLTEVIHNFDTEIIDRYTINRILTINKIWDTDNWEGEIVGGYYGDEVGEIRIIDHLYSKIEEQIKEALFQKETLSDKIYYLLHLEYGYILPSLKNKTFKVLDVNTSLLDFSQQRHLEKVVKKKLEHYSNKNYRDIPRGIAYSIAGKWRVVDGYHRLSENKWPTVKIIAVT